VWRAIVEPEAILAYFNVRKEREVIVDSERIPTATVVLRPRPRSSRT
jgi:hypothetical protein